MKILILTHIFWPESADFKNFALAKALVSRGHEVTVLAPFPNYPLSQLYDGYTMSWRQWEFVEGIKILRVPLYPDHSSSGLKRILNYATFTLSASTIGLMLTGRQDLIYVYAPPMTLGFPAALFKFLNRAPVVLDVVDLWPEAIDGSGMASSEILIKGSEFVANRAYTIADVITVPTAGFADRLQALGIQGEKIFISPNWADRKLFYTAERNSEFGSAYQLDGKFCIIHAGNVGPFQNIDNILHAADILSDCENLRIIFVGAGRDLQRMKAIARERNLNNVIFTGSYPVETMAGIHAWAEALLVSLRSDPYLAINMPGKVSGYLASGKPIIACAEGETNRLITKYGVGLVCNPGDPNLLADTVRQLMDLPEEERIFMGRRSTEVFNLLFDKDLLIEKSIGILESMGVH
jgi:colanic acid biosynthesis glycosyl transferase WcaI